MVWEILREYCVIHDCASYVSAIFLFLFIVGVSAVLIYLGGRFLVKAGRIRRKVFADYISNLVGGIVGGFVLYTVLDIGKSWNRILLNLLKIAFLIFFMGAGALYLTTILRKDKRSRRQHKL